MNEQQLPQKEALSEHNGTSADAQGSHIRKLSHDLSNALEIIVQTSYLLGTVGLTEPASDWLRMLDEGVIKALDLNNSLRTTIRQIFPQP